MAYEDFKGLERRTASDRILRNKAFNIAKNPNYDEYERGLGSMVYTVLDKKSAGSGVNANVNKSTINNKKLAQELHKTIIRKLKKTQFIQDSKTIFCCVSLIFFVNMLGLFLWKIKNLREKILKKSNRKPKKIWAGKGSEFDHSFVKSWLKDNDIEMYSINNEGKYIVAERFIKTLKTKICKYMTSISRNVNINKLDDIANEYKKYIP